MSQTLGGQFEGARTQGNRLLLSGDRHFEYDEFGRLAIERRGKGQSLVTHYHYDSQHQLVRAELPDGTTARYDYDAFGRRIRKRVSGSNGEQVTEFLWQANTLIAESSYQLGGDKRRTDEQYRSFIYEPGSFKPLVQLEGEGRDAEVFHYQLDHLGTPLALTRDNGATAWQVRYRAYGNVWREEIAEVATPLRFQGQYFDAETGLHYNRHRYYQPETGRFITPDPVGLLGGLNGYRYGTNPVRWVDPLGLSNQDALCPGGAVKTTNTAGATKPVDIPMTQEKYDEIINLERGNRPENPRSYLPSEYVDAHEKLFEEQGGGFIQIASWLNPKSPYKTLPNGKFVGLSEDMDVVFDNASKIKDPIGRAKYLDKELALGLDETELKKISQSEIYYIRIKPGDSRFKYKMATGNEPGAIPGEWVPGGKTKGGAKEAALHGAENIKHDGNIEKLLSYFDDTMRLQ